MPAYNAVLFDVDGTLLHSRPGIIDTFSYAFRAMGLDPSQMDLGRYLGPPLRQSFAEHFSDEKDVERAVEFYRTRYAQQGMHMCAPFPGVVDMLKTLREAGIFLATATSKPTAVVTPILEEQGIAGFFNHIGGASMDKSVDTKTAVIRSVLADPRLRDKKILMVGDRKDDMQGAADCAIPAAGVLYGYGSREELEAWNPVILASDCNQLTHYILNI
mgnify:CR=1 FL=1|nr:HAD hydrolase-like protein [uncultured Gemmiger sp.]